MKPQHSKYDREPELHEIYERLLTIFDQDVEKSLFPEIDRVDHFIQLFRLQGKLWLSLYEADSWELIRFVYGGIEGALGMSKLATKFSQDSFNLFIDQVSAAATNPASVKQDQIPDSLGLKLVPVMLVNRCFRIAFVCMMHYKVTIEGLIKAARKGHCEAFHALVSLDSAFLLSDFGQRFLVEAELRNDIDFKDALADALAYNPRIWSLKGRRNQYAFLMLWLLGDFKYRTDRQWADFFADHGFDSWADPANVRRNRERYKLPKLRRPKK
jgi:hypothetical protein